MNPVVLISSVLVGLGALFMMAAVIQGERATRTVPGELKQRWRIMIALMLFFLAGYTLFVVILVSGVSFPTELITGPVFFGGALFVFIVIDLAMRTIGKMKTAEEGLLLLNESLEQRVAERTRDLKESREFLRTVLDSQNDAVIIIDVKDFRIVGANAPFLKELEVTEAEIIGRTCYEVTHNRKDACLPPDDVCPLVETVKTGRHAVVEHVHYGKEGEKLYAEVSTSPIRDKDGNVVRVIHVSRDITARKQADEKLRRYAAELKQSIEDVLSFAYIVSHDLRAPLISIKGFTSELRYSLEAIKAVVDGRDRPMDEEERKKISDILRVDAAGALKFIESSASRMDNQINAILTLSRLGRRELKPEPINMEAVVRAILNSLAHQIEERKVKVTVGKLPEITADRISVEQIMGNLLDNAIKYLEPERDGSIEITAEQGADEYVFRVRDNGRGIAEEDIRRVFELFRRAGKQDVPGEGMGLAYVKALVRRHGGRIWCESEPGIGTTFSFTIPGTREAAL
jgi:PAS domain S-box-containing protein